MSQATLSPVVAPHSGRPATTSRDVAKFFGKRHDNVVRSIQDLISNTPEPFSALNFEAAEYTDEQGKPRPMFILYRDGFMLLVMGYTGKKALALKLAYIEAFNRMEAALAGTAPASPHPLADDMELPDSAPAGASPSVVDELFEDSFAISCDMANGVQGYLRDRPTPGGDAEMMLRALRDLGFSLGCFVQAVDALRAAPRPGAAAVPPSALRLPAGKRLGCLRMAVRLCQAAGAPDRVEEFYGRLCAQLAGGGEEAAGMGLSSSLGLSLEERLREFISGHMVAAPGARLPSRRFFEAFCRWLEERGTLSPTLSITRVTRTVRLARLLPIAHTAPSVVFGEVILRGAPGPAPLPLCR